MAGGLHLVGEEVLGHGDQHAGAVAGLAVGVHRAPVPDSLQGADGELDHLAAGLAVDGADQADAAGVVLRGRIIGVPVDELLPLLVVADQVETVGHGGGSYSAAARAGSALACR